MGTKPLRAGLRLTVSGGLSLLVLHLFSLAQREPRWLLGLAGAAAAALALLIPVMVRGDSWQKMLAGLLLFVPCFGLVMAAVGYFSFS